MCSFREEEPVTTSNMEERTADLLVESIIRDTFPDIPARVLADYWGKNITDEEDMRIIYEAYKDLYLNFDLNSTNFHEHFLANELDDIIRRRNTGIVKGKYYKKFVEKNIVIGPTCSTPSSSYEEETPPPFEIPEPELKELIKKISKKLSDFRSVDMKKFGQKGNLTIDDVLELLKKQRGKCYVCYEDVIISNWVRYCCYQLSIHCIKSGRPHDRDNVLISCFYCNSREHTGMINITGIVREIDTKKVCVEGCHTEPKKIIWHRFVTRQKIDQLLLK